MKTRYWLPLAALSLAALAGCGGGGGDGPPSPECSTNEGCPAREYCSAGGECVAFTNPDECRKEADCDAAEDCVANVCQGAVVAECDKAANVAERARLVAAQPAFEARAKTVISREVTFASVAGNPAESCPVTLSFKDLSGDGTVQPYEDWRLSAAARAADLAGRMSADQKLALMVHPVLADSPTPANPALSAATQAAVNAGVRFGTTAANGAQLNPRATWANNLQQAAEGSALGIPFVLSTEPIHAPGGGRVQGRGFSRWPQELGLGATADLAAIENYGRIVAKEYRAIGVTMALSPSADLATEPRWFGSQFTFGEDGAEVGDRVAAYVKGLQGTALGSTGVAAVASHFPGAGPAKDGWDARLAKGRLVGYPGNAFDAHVAPFQDAIAAGVAGVMTAYGIPETGAWTGLSGAVNGATIEQVGASFNAKLVTDALRGSLGFGGLVVAPPGVLEDAGGAALGAPWGVETMTKAQRAAKAVTAGVDQFLGLADTTALAAARTGGLVTDAQVDAAAKRALAVIFSLGLFEDPYVDPTQAPLVVNTVASYQAGLDAMNRSMVLVVNALKPAGWLNGGGDGTQTADKGNAGNGTLRVLPAPPGEPYVRAGCRYFIMGNFDLDYVRSVSAGYGEMTNDATAIDGVPVTTDAEKIARSDYVFVRVDAPYTADPDSAPLDYSLESLLWGPNANASELDDVAFARTAIAALPSSKTQIIVGVDAGRPSVVSELLAYGVTGIYFEWSVTDKVFLDVAFGIVNGRGKLPVGLPASDAAAAAQLEDVAGDGQHATFVEGFGFDTNAF